MNEATPPDGVAAAAIATSVIVATSVVLYGYLQVKAMKKQRSEPISVSGVALPMAKDPHFLMGHVLMLDGDGDFRKGQDAVYVDPADPVTGLSGLWLGTNPAVSVLLGSHVKTILNSSSYRESFFLFDHHLNHFLGPKSLASLMGKEWKIYRSAVHKSFTPAALLEAQRGIVRVGNALVESLLKKIGSSDSSLIQQPLLPLMKMATIDALGLSVLDVHFECCQKLEMAPFASGFEFLIKDYERRMTTPWDLTTWIYQLPTPANLKHREKRSLVRNYIAEQIDVAKTKLGAFNGKNESGKEGANHSNLLTNILTVAKAEADRNGGQSGISESGMLDLVMMLLFAGYDTTSITLSYALYLVSTHPEIERECLEEINNVMPEGGEELQDPSKQLPYTEAVILETLRLFPPAAETFRTLEKSVELALPAADGKAGKLEKIILPEKTHVFVPIWSVQRDARNFPKPLETHPTRWVQPREGGAPNGESRWEERPGNDDGGSTGVPSANRDAFCAFAAGGRNCVGRKFALSEAITIFAKLLQKLKFELVEEGYVAEPTRLAVIQEPSGGLVMNISSR
jgi:cytochrome P450